MKPRQVESGPGRYRHVTQYRGGPAFAAAEPEKFDGCGYCGSVGFMRAGSPGRRRSTGAGRSGASRSRATLPVILDVGEIRPAIEDRSSFWWSDLRPAIRGQRRVLFHGLPDRFLFTVRVVPCLEVAESSA